MKALLKFFGLMLFAFASYTVTAQDTTKKTTETIKKTARKVGNKTAEIASKGKSSMTDQVYKNKVGPDGQKIYIDDHSRYYWIDKKGHKNYVAEDELKDKSH
ncbi:MAG TPA: hypothetical protein VGI82_11005 [Chitinophagaceae bacterium]|jgi:hypothetical protein